MITVITVPDYNDSFSRVVLAGKEYLIRFSYNFSGDYWTFGIFDHNRNPYVQGIKIVPNSPLNFFSAMDCQKGCLARYPQSKTLDEMISRRIVLSLSFSQRKIF